MKTKSPIFTHSLCSVPGSTYSIHPVPLTETSLVISKAFLALFSLSHIAGPEMSFPFKEATIKYCLRLIDQSNLKPGVEGSSPVKVIKGFGGDFPDLVLVEAIRILDLICKLDASQVRATSNEEKTNFKIRPQYFWQPSRKS